MLKNASFSNVRIILSQNEFFASYSFEVFAKSNSCFFHASRYIKPNLGSIINFTKKPLIIEGLQLKYLNNYFITTKD
jgi:hypothetical protein